MFEKERWRESGAGLNWRCAVLVAVSDIQLVLFGCSAFVLHYSSWCRFPTWAQVSIFPKICVLFPEKKCLLVFSVGVYRRLWNSRRWAASTIARTCITDTFQKYHRRAVASNKEAMKDKHVTVYNVSPIHRQETAAVNKKMERVPGLPQSI